MLSNHDVDRSRDDSDAVSRRSTADGRQQTRLVTLERKKQKLIDAYLDDAISGEDLKPRQMQVEREIADAKGQLLSVEEDQMQLFARLEMVLAALEHAAHVYERGNDETKRNLNQALFEWFEIDLVDEDGEPLAQATAEATVRVKGALSGLFGLPVGVRLAG